MNNELKKNFLFKKVPIPHNIQNNIKNIHDTSILVIDSRHRNKCLYPEPNDYIFELENVYKNIYEIELLNAYVPNSGYFINKYNNSLQLNLDNTIIDLKIPNGDYFQNDDDNFINLDEHIQNTLISYNLNISCKYNYNLQKFIFFLGNDENNEDNILQEFSLNFAGNEIQNLVENSSGNKSYNSYNPKKYNYINNSIGNILGFSAKTFTNQNYIKVKYEIQNNIIKIIFNNCKDYEFINTIKTFKEKYFKKFYIDDDLLIDFGINDGSTTFIKSTNYNNLTIEIEQNLSLPDQDLKIGFISTFFIMSDIVSNFDKDKFLLLEINDFDRFDSISRNIQNSFAMIPLSDSIKYFDNTKNYGNLKKFNPILPKLNKIHIKFKTFEGNLYDFNSKEHCIILAINFKTNLR